MIVLGLLRRQRRNGVNGGWSWLRDADDLTLQSRMTSFFDGLAGTDEGQRRQRLRPLIDAEYHLPDEVLRRVTMARLRALLTLSQDAAERVAGSYDAIMNSLEGEIAFKRAALVQQMARELSIEEEERLHSLLPNVFGDKPANLQIAKQVEEPAAGVPELQENERRADAESRT